MRFADLDAVTVDAFGTLVEVDDPVPALQRSLAERGIDRDAAAVGRAFAAEADFYRAHTSVGRDPGSLAGLRERCVEVFAQSLGVELEGFVDAYLAALVFRPLPGAVETLQALRARGLALAVVSNWDLSLGDVLIELGIAQLVDTVVTSAEAGADKPDPAIFLLALGRLGVPPSRALHVGDQAVDEQGAPAVGMRFAPAPLGGLV